jgi:hypothetical protein
LAVILSVGGFVAHGLILADIYKNYKRKFLKKCQNGGISAFCPFGNEARAPGMAH